ncbi:hypothetical protein EDD86DRAFT_257469 [Gorgonomyces haynaldii]|nr:hypothetical protein EDD86DRAFT_257469 [Gorgonomyces haynaldii]
MLFLIQQILALDCTAPQTLWDKHACQIVQPKYQPNCAPIAMKPQNGTIKGAIVLYHGFSACPDAMKETAQLLADQGFLAFVPLLPGHGLALGYGCVNPKTCLSRGTNPSELPTSKEPYVQFVDWSLSMIQEQAQLVEKSSEFFIGTLGLSLGGSMSFLAATRPNSPITRVLVANPFYAATFNSLDFLVAQCKTQQNPAQCITNALAPPLKAPEGSPAVDTKNGTIGNGPKVPLFNTAKLVDSFKSFFIQSTVGNIMANRFDFFMNTFADAIARAAGTFVGNALSSEYGWGDVCWNAVGRGGYCTFLIKNLAAIQSFSEFATGQYSKFPQTTVYANIHSDLDGYSRDAISFQVVQQLQSQRVRASRCHFATICTLEQMANGEVLATNECGVPHSLLSQAEATHVSPFSMYWKPSLEQNIIGFFDKSTDSIGVQEGDYTQCVATSQMQTTDPVFGRLGANYLQKASSFAQ